MWIAKLAKGIDIREYGSKNAGLTNVFRVLGWKPAIPVVVIDLLKGFLAPTIAAVWNAHTVAAGGPDFFWLPLAAGVLVILGHSFTCFAGFRGGKGVLTALGVFLALMPVTALVCLAVWALLTFTTKYVSVGSISACVCLAVLPVIGFLKPDIYPDKISAGLLILCLAVAVFVIVKHRANIVRLLNGTENGFGSKRRTPKDELPAAGFSKKEL